MLNECGLNFNSYISLRKFGEDLMKTVQLRINTVFPFFSSSDRDLEESDHNYNSKLGLYLKYPVTLTLKVVTPKQSLHIRYIHSKFGDDRMKTFKLRQRALLWRRPSAIRVPRIDRRIKMKTLLQL